jgi:hypothetical protein
VHEHARLALRDRGADLGARERRSEADRPARERLAHAQEIGRDRRVLAREHLAGAPEAGRDLVGDQQHAVLVAQRARARQIVGRVEPHAARALYDRLEDQRGELVAVRAQQVGEPAPVLLAARLVEAARGPFGEVLDRQRAREQAVHARDGIAHGHRAERVAVIGAAQREQTLAARLSARVPVLQGELDRDLDRHGARVAQEHALESRRREREQPLAQRDGGLVREAAEHHVRHALELRAHGGLDVRMAIAVDRRPPRRHAVDELAAVGEPQRRAPRALDRVQRRRARRRVGMPDGAAVARDQRMLGLAHPATVPLGLRAPRPSRPARRFAPTAAGALRLPDARRILDSTF